jgi:hypothetical protein
MSTATATLASAPTRRRRHHARPSTQERHVPDTPPGLPEEPEFREISGVRCTDRRGIAILAGVAGGAALEMRAKRDKDFPQPLERIGRTYWYPLEGETGVDAYLLVLEERGEGAKPPAVADGDPEDLLNPDEAAAALHISRGAFDRYVAMSRPHWEAAARGETLPGNRYPQLPSPDVETTGTNRFGEFIHREWYRGTLARHQETRRGQAANRGTTRTLS